MLEGMGTSIAEMPTSCGPSIPLSPPPLVNLEAEPSSALDLGSVPMALPQVCVCVVCMSVRASGWVGVHVCALATSPILPLLGLFLALTS